MFLFNIYGIIHWSFELKRNWLEKRIDKFLNDLLQHRVNFRKTPRYLSLHPKEAGMKEDEEV